MSRPRSNSDPSTDNKKEKAPLPISAALLKPQLVNWGKKSSTGYVGMSNQGATCYLNSLLQCLYMTPEFRHALFSWRYKPPPNTQFEFDFMDDSDTSDATGDIDGAMAIHDEPPEHSIMFQLQCLFARLHRSVRGACSTRPLTKSFHWDDGQAFQQHDVQELLRVLFEAVSRTLSRVDKGDLLNDLCKGMLLDYLTCQTCQNGRSREDIFLDLSLTIESVSSLEDALQRFIEPELMEKDNQVNCAPCASKQDFKKGLKFRKLPPLLIVQLKRFHYDWMLDRRVKLSHRVSFPRQLDMKAFLASDVLETEVANADDLKYTLYGVIIQSGGALGGHYFANIKSFEDGKWYRFNDASVRPLDDREFDEAFGGETVRGTGYVLMYRRSNLKLPTTSGEFPAYLERMVQKEDAEIKLQWEQWQKEMRSVTVCVEYPQAKPRPKVDDEAVGDAIDGDAATTTKPDKDGEDDEAEAVEKDKNPILEYRENGTQVRLKLDVEEWTFSSLLNLVRSAFDINDDEIAVSNTRLRKYHIEYEFVAEGYDDVNIQSSKIAIAKWPKRGLFLRLETKTEHETFSFFDADDILIKLFVVDAGNTRELVDRGFVQSATFKTQELPRGGQCTAVVNAKLPLAQVKPLLYAALQKHEVVPSEWLADGDAFDASTDLNLLRFDYNKVTIFGDDAQSLSDYHTKLGAMLFVERKKKKLQESEEKHEDDKLAEIPLLSPSYQRSALALYFEEQRLKISVTFNEPLPSQSVQDKLEELLMTPQMLQDKKQRRQAETTTTTTTRLEFTHAVRLSKECALRQLKTRIASELQLDMNAFRLRKNSTSPELRDLSQTLNSAGIHDGGLVYVEHGVPTGPRQTCVTFALYDPNKQLTDPHKKKKTLAQKLFEWPFARDLKVAHIKTQIVGVLNELFPLYRGRYNFPQAIKVLRDEDEARQQREVEALKKATELSKGLAETTEEEEQEAVENKEPEPVQEAAGNRNIFGIEHVRLRKQKGAKVLEMYFDDQTLSSQCVKKDAIQIVIEKIPIAEHFTKNHLCFWAQKYRPDQGKNGKVFRKREFVIDKRSKMVDLKLLIARLLKKSDASHCYAHMSDAEVVRNVSVTKGLSVTPMNASNVLKRQWVHRAALMQVGIDPDRYLYQLPSEHSQNTKSEDDMKSTDTTATSLADADIVVTETKSEEQEEEQRFTAYDGNSYNDAEILAVMQHALASENDDIVSRTPFHLRNGDLIVWTDIGWRPTEVQIAERRKQEQEKGLNASKTGGGKNGNRTSKNSSVSKKGNKRAEAGGIKIRTYEEYLEDEQRKKEEEQQRQAEKEKLLQKDKEKVDTKGQPAKEEDTEVDMNMLEKKILFNAMVAEDVNDLQNPKPTNRQNRTGSF